MDDRAQNLTVGVVIGVLVVACLCVACLLGIWLFGSPKSPLMAWIASPTPTATQTPTPTATPTNTPIPTDTPTPEGPPTRVPGALFVDDFNNNENEWGSEYKNSEVSIQNGQLHLVSTEEKVVAMASCGEPCGPYTKFYYQAEVVLDPVVDLNHGIAFGFVNAQNYYVFEVDTEFGGYALYQLVDNSWETMIDWEKHSAVFGGSKPNRLAVQVSENGNVITMWINGIFIREYTIPGLYAAGKIGFFVNGTGTTLIADNVEVYESNPYLP